MSMNICIDRSIVHANVKRIDREFEGALTLNERAGEEEAEGKDASLRVVHQLAGKLKY